MTTIPPSILQPVVARSAFPPSSLIVILAPRAAKRGLDTVFFATPNDHAGDAVPTNAGDHG